MLKKTKKLAFALSVLSLVCVGAGFSSLGGVTAGAEKADATDLYISEGASVRVRLDEKEENGEIVNYYDTAIRFTANASADLVSSLVETTGETVAYKTGAELGMFIVPQEYMVDYSEQSSYTDYFEYFLNVKNKTKEEISYICKAEELDTVNGMKYRVAIMKFLEENYNRAYQSVAWYTLDGVTYYTEPSDVRTVSYVVDKALQDPEENFLDVQKKAMAGFVERAIELKVNAVGTGENALHTVAIHGDNELDLKARFVPEITASDLTFTVAEGEDVVEVENGVASALTEDDATAKVKVTAYGGLVDFDVTVRTTAKGTTEVIDFAGMNDLETAKVVSEGSATTITYLDSFEGATGVAKMTATFANGSWGHFGFQPVYDMETYADSYYIVFRMYIEDGFNGVFWFGGGNNCLTAIETGKWVDYYFPAQVFKKNWANCATDYYVSNMALVTSKAGEFYIDEIYTVANAPMASNEVNSFSDELQIKSLKSSGSTLTYVDSYQGETGVVKATATDSWAGIGIKPLQDMSVYADSYYIVMRMYVVNSGVLWLGGGNNCLTAIQTGVWADYYFPAQVFKKNWANWTTNYTLDNMALVISSAFEIYIDEIYTVANAPVASNEVNSFTDETQIKSLQANGSTALTYVDSYQGETGVVKATATDIWGGIGVKPLQDMAAYANSAYVVFRMYIVSSGDLWFGGGKNCLTAIQTGVWADYYFPAQVFKKNWANWTTNYYVDSMALVNSNVFEVYIDEIYVTGTAPTGNKVVTFDDATQIYSTAKNSASNITWAAEYAGATGVAKMTTSGTWGYFGIKPMQDMCVYANCKYIVFRMYFVDSADVVLWFGGANNCQNPGDIKVGEWVDCYFPGDKFTTNWANWTTEYKIDSMVVSFNKNVGTVYVDEVFVANELPA